MTFPTRRKYTRNPDHIPILCAGYNDKSYSEAMMCNSCPDGMYFESESRLQPNTKLYIKVQRLPPNPSELQPFKAFRARVKWCRQVTGGNKPRYGTGVKFTAKSHLSYGINIQNFDHFCDYCEKKTIDGLIHQTETGLLLCPDCCHYMETLPKSVEENLERFLMGNVI